MQSRIAHCVSHRWSRFVIIAVASAAGLTGCGEETVAPLSSPTPTATATATPPPTPQMFAVLSTFPAEMAPLLAQMTVEHTATVNGRTFRVGTLAGVPVILGITGIGLVNAARTTGELLDRFDVAGVLLSAVAGGSTQQIGDVAVPAAFELKDGSTFAVTPAWLAAISPTAAAGTVMLDQCTVVANPPPTTPVCMPRPAAIILGGIGMSSDPYGGKPFACITGGNDLYGCDLPSPPPSDPSAGPPHPALFQPADAVTPVTQDMETAAIAREALARGVPFIGFRAISDGGTGDSLGLVGFLPQFSAYYRFAARNAAAVTVAELTYLAAHPARGE